jgi:hypothetical protein
MVMTEKLEPIIEYTPKIEKNGEEYIPFCNFEFHRGIIVDNRKCEEGECPYYKKLYFTEDI